MKADILGPENTPYENRSFELKLVIPSEFPTCPPRGFFLTKIYHPNVDVSNGAICVNTLKKDWTPETTLSHVLSIIRCLLIVPFPESSLNDEAGKLFMDSYDEYARRAHLLATVHGKVINTPHTKGPLSVKCSNVSDDSSNLPNAKRRDNAKSKNDKKNKKKGLKRL